MRSLVADTVGEPSEVLHLQVRPIPEPGPGQVRIRVAAVPVEASDLHTIRGRYGFTPEFPTVPGIESVGVIDELGSGTEGFTIGQRVVTIAVTGTWQEFVVADVERVLPVPAGMSNSTAAQILSNPLTAVILTGDELDVRPGEWLLQTAAGSTVGQMVIQLGGHVGFKTLNVVRRRSAVGDILGLGGDAVICTEDEDLRERVAEIAGLDGVSKAIDCVSGQVGADVSRALAPGGQLVVFGALSTHRQTEPDKLTIPVFARSLIYETKTVRGFWLFRWFTETPTDRMAATIDRTLRLADSGVLRVPEGQPIPIEKFSDAVHLAEAPEHGSKPLLVFEP
ncbi:zinc-dependent alcohol dehydrogenase family protein [Mycobacterium sp. Aquia_213]|uniref:zinc-dependent alcohol dehydrogenase family protein n=1 Tax=Mycobacterium sp. Aquia_213 TaxID=2991728 RepID=UPI00226E9AFC|nr:zinc-dependent alcohol dehydrogenase family protein [Mycobacterium sp. Aquia_213]WAC93377.1 zinc-dependent alcohol dehydrogenase family protein [Mycobacterium sp. Aquia_213]